MNLRISQKKVINIDSKQNKRRIMGKINRVGVTNAADRGLDMWSNFGLAIQVKHLTLNEELAEDVVSQITADRIVIICKNVEKRSIKSLLNQIGWKTRIQSIITDVDLHKWYEKALRGKFSDITGDSLLSKIQSEIEIEFPASNKSEFNTFVKSRNYTKIKDKIWI